MIGPFAADLWETRSSRGVRPGVGAVNARSRPRPIKVFTTCGRLPVIVCPLCAALVVAAGEYRHAAAHRADRERP